MHLLKKRQAVVPKSFSFDIFTRISVRCIRFLLTNSVIFVKASPTLTFELLEIRGLDSFLIAETLGIITTSHYYFQSRMRGAFRENINISDFWNFQTFLHVGKDEFSNFVIIGYYFFLVNLCDLLKDLKTPIINLVISKSLCQNFDSISIKNYAIFI